MHESTRRYYDENAAAFADATFGLDLTALYAPFLELLPAQARILDAGCGSGRDALHFSRLGHEVVAFDASAEMAREASRRTGLKVLTLSFSDLDFHEEFDGVWACASLLHLRRADIPLTLSALTKALRPGGAMYASFKHGEAERCDSSGRYFQDLTRESFGTEISSVQDLQLVKAWVSPDIRSEHRQAAWLNVLAQKIMLCC